MKLIVGLGNPGEQYAHTRHNLGFIVIDEIAHQLGSKWSTQTKLKSQIVRASINNDDIILVKPQTFMNLSGEAVQAIARFYKIEPTNIWVISDDIDLPFAKLRLRIGGSAGGHNGLRSIIEYIGEGFVRVRIGIGHNEHMPSEKYVLQKFSTSEISKLPLISSRAAERIVQQLQLSELESTSFELSDE